MQVESCVQCKGNIIGKSDIAGIEEGLCNIQVNNITVEMGYSLQDNVKSSLTTVQVLKRANASGKWLFLHLLVVVVVLMDQSLFLREAVQSEWPG